MSPIAIIAEPLTAAQAAADRGAQPHEVLAWLGQPTLIPAAHGQHDPLPGWACEALAEYWPTEDGEQR